MASKKNTRSRKNRRQNPKSRVLWIAIGVGVLLIAAVTALLIFLFTRDNPDDPADPPFNLSDYIDAPHIGEAVVNLSEIDEAYADLLTEIRYRNAEYTAADSTEIAAGQFDRVSFSYTGVPEDVEVGDDLLAALTGESSAVIGSDALYPAYTNPQNPELSTKSFEEQLIGVRLGQTIELLVTYPENGSASGVDVTPILGKRVRFTLTVTALEIATLPEITDSLISRYTNGDFGTVEQFRQDAYKTIRTQYAYLALYDLVSVKICPDELVDAETLRYIQNIALTEYDLATLTDEQIKKIYDELHDEAAEYAKSAVADRMINDFLCDYAEIRLTDAEYAAALAADFTENAVAYSYLGIDSEAELEERYGRDNLFTAYRTDKLMNTIVSLVRFE